MLATVTAGHGHRRVAIMRYCFLLVIRLVTLETEQRVYREKCGFVSQCSVLLFNIDLHVINIVVGVVLVGIIRKRWNCYTVFK